MGLRELISQNKRASAIGGALLLLCAGSSAVYQLIHPDGRPTAPKTPATVPYDLSFEDPLDPSAPPAKTGPSAYPSPSSQPPSTRPSR